MKINITIPTRQHILQDFEKWVKLGADPEFQFERVKRRWNACGYSLAELPLFFERRVYVEKVELDFDHPEEALEIFSHLGYMGYDSFELIQQYTPAITGPETYLPEDCNYLLDLTAAARQWCKNLTYRNGFKMPVWYDLHARHPSAEVSPGVTLETLLKVGQILDEQPLPKDYPNDAP